MSSAGRSAAAGTGHTRHPSDFFETPGWCVRAILPHLSLAGRVLEPSAGRGAIVKELLVAGVSASNIHAVELDEGRARDVNGFGVMTSIGDFTDPVEVDGLERSFDLVIGNPPFRDAEKHVRRALECVRPGGTVCLLLRLAFLESATRAGFHREHPSDVYVLPRRPSFTGNGKSDSAAVAWFCWGPARGGRWFRLDG